MFSIKKRVLEEIYGLENILIRKMERNINGAKCAIIQIKAESIEPVISKPHRCEHPHLEVDHEIECAVTIKDEECEDSSVQMTTRSVSNTGIPPNDINIKLDLSDYVDEQDKGRKGVDKTIDNFDISVGKCNSVSKCTKIHDDEKYKCKICSKHFKTRKILWGHSKIHDGREYVCEICDKRFTEKRYLSYHMKSHARTNTNERNYKCEICGKCFFMKGDLLRHTKWHTDERNYKCKICIKCFKTKRCALDHMKIHVEKYVCDICNKRFTTKRSMLVHIKTHTRESCYKCEICAKGFKTKNQASKHMKTHVEKYICDICNKCFTMKQSLSRHIDTHMHTGERNYECEICNKRFMTKHSKSRHKKTHANMCS